MASVRFSTALTAFLSLAILGLGIAGIVLLQVILDGRIIIECPFCHSFAYAPAVAALATLMFTGIVGMIAAALPQRSGLNAFAAFFVVLCFVWLIYLHIVTMLQAFTSEGGGSLQGMWERCDDARKCDFSIREQCRGYGIDCIVNDVTNTFTANCPDCSSGPNATSPIPLSVPRCGSVMAKTWQGLIIPITTVVAGVNLLLILLAYAFALRAAYARSAAAPTADGGKDPRRGSGGADEALPTGANDAPPAVAPAVEPSLEDTGAATRSEDDGVGEASDEGFGESSDDATLDTDFSDETG